MAELKHAVPRLGGTGDAHDADHEIQKLVEEVS